MSRVTISLEDELTEQFKAYIKEQGYKNRSEAMRDLIREKLEKERLKKLPDGDCIANLSYIYNHHERELSRRLTQEHHQQHDLSISTLHVHLDHDNCMETVVLKGTVSEVRTFANRIIAQSGVRHGKLYLIPVSIEEQSHTHETQEHKREHSHTHIHPKN